MEVSTVARLRISSGMTGICPQGPKAIAKELVEDKKIFSFVLGTGTACGMAVKKYLHNKKVMT